MAEDMNRNNGFIPGIKPGKQTAEYIDVIMSVSYTHLDVYKRQALGCTEASYHN